MPFASFLWSHLHRQPPTCPPCRPQACRIDACIGLDRQRLTRGRTARLRHPVWPQGCRGTTPALVRAVGAPPPSPSTAASSPKPLLNEFHSYNIPHRDWPMLPGASNMLQREARDASACKLPGALPRRVLQPLGRGHAVAPSRAHAEHRNRSLTHSPCCRRHRRHGRARIVCCVCQPHDVHRCGHAQGVAYATYIREIL